MLQSVLHFSFISVFFIFIPFQNIFSYLLFVLIFALKNLVTKSIFRFLLNPRLQLKFMVIFLFANSVLFLNSSISFSAANSLICLFEVHNNFFSIILFLLCIISCFVWKRRVIDHSFLSVFNFSAFLSFSEHLCDSSSPPS